MVDERSAVVGREPGGQRPGGDRLLVDRQALGFAVEVHRQDPGSSPIPWTTSGRPPLIETPPSNQHIAPALRPASTIPRSQAVRIASSIPCSRQIASMLRIEPPPM